ncbi:replication initiator protein A [Priestia megaterium]|uniref:replication initiator protein A n=1 Tax=Priestia megaterium TaxID=1404 RepID=UPI003D2C93F6
MTRYFTESDMDNLIHYQVPKILLIGDKYKSLNPNAMKLYIILLDRLKLSMKNNWKKDGKYYVRISIGKGSDLLGFSESTFKRAKKELAKYELLEEDRIGKNISNRLFPLKLEYSEEDIYRLNNEVDDLLEEEEKSAEEREEKWNGQKALSGKNKRKGQNELTDSDQQNQRKGQNEPVDGSKRTTSNNNYNNNKNINNNFVNKENPVYKNSKSIDETISKLCTEYMSKGLNKDICLKVASEALEKIDFIDNFGGYLRNSLQGALHSVQWKTGQIIPEEKYESQPQFQDFLNVLSGKNEPLN